MAGAPRLSIDGLEKRFSGVAACAGIDLVVDAGEIHALLGENGAGKSTLVKMVYGALASDGGSMLLDGAPFAPRSPADARARGIGFVFQHFSLFEGLTVLENIALALPGARPGKAIAGQVEALARRYGLEIAPERRVAELSVGERQRVEVLRALVQSPRLLILDEPTSVLTPQEAEALFTTLRALAAEGRSVLYISHKLEEVRRLCARATVLRQGRVVATCIPGAETTRSLAEMMLGAAVQTTPLVRPPAGPVRLALVAARRAQSETTARPLAPVSLEVRSGEIVGIAGIAGNGQSELMALLTGETRVDANDAIRVDGRPIGRADVTRRRRAGFAFVPEERLGRGAIGDFTLVENTLLTGTAAPSRFGLLNLRAAHRLAERIASDHDVRTPGVTHPAMTLSGGNLQKFVVGRALAHEPGVLIIAQPTWGVDANAQAAIHERLRAIAAGGAAVLVISQDLDELLALADRIAVIAAGVVGSARPTHEITIEEIGIAMAGQAGRAAAAPSQAEAGA